MDSNNPLDVLVIIASHNRKEKTLAAIESLYTSANSAGVTLHVVLGDATSKDGTSEAVSKSFPDVEIVLLNSDHYWAGSMRKIWEKSADVPRRYEMWLNDDVVLFEHSLKTLIGVSQDNGDNVVVIGSTSDPIHGGLTYGGQKLGSRWNFLNAEMVLPGNQPRPADIGHGNIVLYSESVSNRIGGFPAGFTHAMADTYFFWKANRLGKKVLVAPGFHGNCETNTTSATWKDTSLSRKERWALLNSPKGLPFTEWARICFSLGGFRGFRYLMSPALRVLLCR